VGAGRDAKEDPPDTAGEDPPVPDTEGKDTERRREVAAAEGEEEEDQEGEEEGEKERRREEEENQEDLRTREGGCDREGGG
jgi:hypothetical protein